VESFSGLKGVLFICIIDDVAGIVKTTAAKVGPYDRADLKSMMEALGMLAIGGVSQNVCECFASIASRSGLGSTVSVYDGI
jgi:hypothetical protein